MSDAIANGGHSLPPGYELDEYVIEREIGTGGFGVTYKAHDRLLERPVAIKEYFPSSVAARGSSHTVSPKTTVASDLEEYEWGLRDFIDEARRLARFSHPNVIRVIRYTERNGTAYIVMEFAAGRDLSRVLSESGTLSVAQAREWVVAIATGLEQVHAAGILHRDIKPPNIRIRDDGSPVLIDFGAARQAIGNRSQSISMILTPGYAPIEQYSRRGDQGPWTDIYSLSAVAYEALTGERMHNHDATDRIRKDTLVPLEARLQDADHHFLAAIDWGMRPEETERPRDVGSWLAAMDGESLSPSIEAPGENGVTPSEPWGAPSGRLTTGRPSVSVRKTTGTVTPASIVPSRAPGSSIAPSLRQPDPPSQSGTTGAVAVSPPVAVTDAPRPSAASARSLAIGAGAAMLLVVAGGLFYAAAGRGGPRTVMFEDSTVPPVSTGSQGAGSADGPTLITNARTDESPGASASGPGTLGGGSGASPPSETGVGRVDVDDTDRRDFALAQQIDTTEAYSLYLRLHPTGAYRAEAEAGRRR